MKNTTYKYILTYCTFCLLFSACKKEKEDTFSPAINGSGTINNELVNFQSFGRSLDFVTVLLEFFDDNGYVDGSIGFYLEKETLKEKRYIITDSIRNNTNVTSIYSSRTQDGDVISGIYHVVETDDFEDFLNITHYDEAAGIVRGEFQGNYALDTAFQFNDVDTIFIENGTFEVTLQD